MHACMQRVWHTAWSRKCVWTLTKRVRQQVDLPSWVDALVATPVHEIFTRMTVPQPESDREAAADGACHTLLKQPHAVTQLQAHEQGCPSGHPSGVDARLRLGVSNDPKSEGAVATGGQAAEKQQVAVLRAYRPLVQVCPLVASCSHPLSPPLPCCLCVHTSEGGIPWSPKRLDHWPEERVHPVLARPENCFTCRGYQIGLHHFVRWGPQGGPKNGSPTCCLRYASVLWGRVPMHAASAAMCATCCVQHTT
jgi:hypothetical protein